MENRRRTMVAALIAFLAISVPLCVARADGPAVVQFRAERFETNGVWLAERNGAALTPAFNPSHDWVLPVSDREFGVLFASSNGVSAPLGFPRDSTNMVFHVMVVAGRTSAATPRATLLDGQVALRFQPCLFPWEEPTLRAESRDGQECFVFDGRTFSTPGTQFPASGTHLLEIAFPTGHPANELFVGGSPASPEWNRAWPGFVREIVFAMRPLLEPETASLRSYFALRHGLSFVAPPPGEAGQILNNLGIRSDSVFSTLFLVR